MGYEVQVAVVEWTQQLKVNKGQPQASAMAHGCLPFLGVIHQAVERLNERGLYRVWKLVQQCSSAGSFQLFEQIMIAFSHF